MDVLFMTLRVMKHAGAWDLLGRVFRIRGPTFERLIDGFINVLAMVIEKRLIEPVAEMLTMSKLREAGDMFDGFPFAIEAVDVTFQHTNRPIGSMQEGKVYHSGKHKIYGYKFEVAVQPNGLES